jgi:hypothetical protein
MIEQHSAHAPANTAEPASPTDRINARELARLLQPHSAEAAAPIDGVPASTSLGQAADLFNRAKPEE